MAMFEDADPYNRGTITYEALKDQLEKHGGLLENLSIRYLCATTTEELLAYRGKRKQTNEYTNEQIITKKKEQIITHLYYHL